MLPLTSSEALDRAAAIAAEYIITYFNIESQVADSEITPMEAKIQAMHRQHLAEWDAMKNAVCFGGCGRKVKPQERGYCRLCTFRIWGSHGKLRE